jgi:peptidoglycan/xylan/chitin deacetylase (PgdA/CDA1 family)
MPIRYTGQESITATPALVPKVTLSFDNGPEPDVTPRVLDMLAKHAIKASFFVLGRKVVTPAGRALAERAHAEGHWIGNHTYSHTQPLGELDRETALREFVRAEESLAWLEQPERLFRPYGRQGRLGKHLLHPAVVEKIVEDKFTVVLWNTVPGDWRDADGWVATALKQCASQERSLVVLHDHIAAPMKHLDRFLNELKDSGAEIVQEYPDDCVPIRQGRIVGAIERWTVGRGE